MKRATKTRYNDSMPKQMSSMPYEIDGMEDALIPYGSDEPDDDLEHLPNEEEEEDGLDTRTS